MDTNIESARKNNFIYALGLFCLLNIFSSEFKAEESNVKNEVKHTNIIADCIRPSYLFI